VADLKTHDKELCPKIVLNRIKKRGGKSLRIVIRRVRRKLL